MNKLEKITRNNGKENCRTKKGKKFASFLIPKANENWLLYK